MASGLSMSGSSYAAIHIVGQRVLHFLHLLHGNNLANKYGNNNKYVSDLVIANGFLHAKAALMLSGTL